MALVFLPGARGSSSFWKPVADRLADLEDLTAFGYPGFDEVAADPRVRSLDDLYRWIVERLPPGASDVVAQSMGGVLASRLSIEHPDRVRRLVLAATSGGVDVERLGATDWRADYRASLPQLPGWFVDDRTDLSERIAAIRAPTLLLWSDSDPISPLAIGRFLADRIGGARLVVVSGGTHSFAHERADEVAPLIRAHLA